MAADDINCVSDVDALFSDVGGMLSVMQSFARCITTPRGSHPNPKLSHRFFSLWAFVNEALTNSDLVAIKAACELEADYDTRIQRADVTPALVTSGDGKTISLRLHVTLYVDGQAGSFKMWLRQSDGKIIYKF